jgi:hypothetical protein
MKNAPAFHTRDAERGKHWRDYWPLFVLIAVSALAATAITLPQPTLMLWMHGYMGVFLCLFATLKLFHPEAFANGFVMYDLLAKRVRAYAYLYPYLELALGLCYLGFIAPQITYIVTIALFAFGALGVLVALRRGLDINCPCMGSILQVPLSTVTLTEDGAMIAMAAIMLLQLG